MTRTKKPRRPGERAGLDAAAVLAAARSLAAAEGIQALSMRRLADGLGVAANAIYSHYPDKAALLDALLDDLLGGIEAPPGPAAEWEQRLAEILRGTRRVLLAHPELVPLYLARPGRGPHAMRLGNAMLECLAAAGLQSGAAVEALRILLIYALGFAAHEAPRRGDPAGEQRIRDSESAFRSARHLPHLSALSADLARHPDDAAFETGLRWLIAGIAADARRRRR